PSGGCRHAPLVVRASARAGFHGLKPALRTITPPAPPGSWRCRYRPAAVLQDVRPPAAVPPAAARSAGAAARQYGLPDGTAPEPPRSAVAPLPGEPDGELIRLLPS